MQKVLVLFLCLSVALASSPETDTKLLSFDEFIGRTQQHAQTKAQKYIKLKSDEYSAVNLAWNKADTIANDLNKLAANAVKAKDNPVFTDALAKKAIQAATERDKLFAQKKLALERWDDAKANANKWTAAQWTKIEAADKARIQDSKSPKQKELEKVAKELEGYNLNKQGYEKFFKENESKYNKLVERRNALMATTEWKQLIKKFGFNPIDPVNVSKRPKKFNQDKDMTAAQSLAAGDVVSIGYQLDELSGLNSAARKHIDDYNKLILELTKWQQHVQFNL